ncbi:SusC/RagA family TonB-linked outer membrane protein [Niabella aurantiaca]|uniref:SusC/RagA family TonB-linked outer membrane protein n=1 Tax=Niabella aurantiaca TaxID=379900 RepID=UPI001B7F982B|nr:TonB-dependent receptor [Niabella aurantiaca]
MFFSIPFNSLCQDNPLKTITGIVTDSTTGERLAGVVISLSRLQSGKITNGRGEFTFRARPKDTLVFSHVGYLSVRVPVDDQTAVDVQMVKFDTELEDVVVIGYGQVKKGDLTGSVAEVNVDDIMKAPVPNVAEALAGRVAGLQVSSDDGQPGSESNMIIRGGNSLTQSNAPLYVVDGFPIEDFSMASLNPDDIASINVLKDASATAIYGARGANGVIIIETKKGAIGQPVITYSGYAALQRATKRMEMMDAYEFVKYQLEINPEIMTERYLTNPGRTLEDYRNINGTDWQDLLFHNAIMQNHSLSLRGGTNKTKYAVSTSAVDQEGVIINSGYNRQQGRFTLDQTISKKLKASLNINYTRDKNYGAISSSQANSSNAYATYLMYRTWGYRPISTGGDDLIDDLFDEEVDGGNSASSLLTMNPIISTKNEIRQQTRNNLQANLGIDYDITKELTLKITGGYNYRTTKNEAFNNSKTYRGYPSAVNLKGVNGSYSNTELIDWVNENTLNYKKRINKDNQVDFTGGFTMQGTSLERYGYVATNIPNEELGLRAMELGLPSAVTSSASKNALVSFLGRANYNYKSKYYLTASIRADGSSKFSKQNRWGYFPSAGLMWRLGKEQFIENTHVIDDAKIRMTYGSTGNNRVSDFARFFSLDLSDYYSFGNAIPDFAAVIDNMGNPDLRWERTDQLDLGLDFSLLKNRIQLTIDAYAKTTRDLLLRANLPYSSGFRNAYKNVGAIRNRGLEFSLATTNIRTRNFSWESNFNISFNDNKITALSEDQPNIISSVSFTGDFNATPLYIAKLGGPAAAFYGYKWGGVYQFEDFDQQADGSYLLKQSVPTNGLERTAIQPGDSKYVDQNGDGVVNELDLVVIGRGLPIHYGGFNNNFTYKQFSLNIFLQWSYGNDIMNANRIAFEGNFANRQNLNQYASYENRWTPENPTNDMYRTGGFGPRGIYSSRTIEDGSFLRLKTVQLAYAFPQKILGRTFKALSLYVSGQNLYTWTSYSGMDPEVSTKNSVLTPGFDYSAYARNLITTFGIKATL